MRNALGNKLVPLFVKKFISEKKFKKNGLFCFQSMAVFFSGFCADYCCASFGFVDAWLKTKDFIGTQQLGVLRVLKCWANWYKLVFGPPLKKVVLSYSIDFLVGAIIYGGALSAKNIIPFPKLLVPFWPAPICTFLEFD